MKKILPILLLGAAFTASAANDVYTTPGTGKVYTFAELAKIADSGVTQVGDTFKLIKDIEIVAKDGLKLDNKAVISFGPSVIVRIKGTADFAVADTTTVVPQATANKAQGFHFTDTESEIKVAHVRFEEVGIRIGGPVGATVENCTFYEHNGSMAKSAVAFVGASVGSVIRNNYFLRCQFAAIGSGANVPAGKIIENNIMEDCGTSNRNYPVINENPSGNNGEVIIRNNTVIGGKHNVVGALSMSNMLGMTGRNKVTIEGNKLSDSRYGMNILGNLMDIRIINNEIINCHYEPKAVNGGSGITINASQTSTNCYVEGNLIDGCLWGITIIGGPNVNLGHLTENTTDSLYNPGRNIFKNNGNCGTTPEGAETAYDPSIPYDLYNNTVNTVYAQGNEWGGPDQTAAEIEKRIYHKADDDKLGEVIFMPSWNGPTALESLTADNDAFGIVMIGNGSFKLTGVDAKTMVEIYTLAGSKVWNGPATDTITPGVSGVVIVKAGKNARSIIL